MKKLLIFKHNKIGRCGGKILCHTKGSKKKILYRLIDFNLKFLFLNPFFYLKLVKGFNSNTFLILVLNLVGFFFYILAAEKVKIPLIILNSVGNNFLIGTANIVGNLTEGALIFNLPNVFCKNNYIARSAGLFGQILKKNFDFDLSLIRLRNGQKILLSNMQCVLIGVASNLNFHNLIVGKAGFRNNLGFKSIVRGVAKNPIDHPNGGRTPGGKVYRSFSFKIARSTKKTSKIKYYNKYEIIL